MRHAICCLLLIFVVVSSRATAADGVLPSTPAAPTTSAYDPSASMRAVHIDTLDPQRQQVFIEARLQWLKELAQHHTTDGRGYFLQRDDHTLITLRSFKTFTEYDALRAFRATVGARIGADGEQAGKRYDAGDVAITSPHNSEVWSRQEALDYHPPGPALNEYTAGYMRMLVEQVHSDDYESAWTTIRAALTTAHYPIARISFFSMLGSGRQISLWLAPDRDSYERAGTPEAAVARVLGQDQARDLFARLAAARSQAQDFELLPRADLKSPE